ncbi:hypothetical protein [Marinoscillum furvescens]|uniref:Uncharacterized protein n=1 Tax=Marinoscillum furvescens DSM 4134 TaxID=1122208 RepID=A0A3D9KX70_MARFU|nr:hypothetical protein [Marinoscillum furvescens]RED92195.1 hypothetical protein C7460_1327 [Marinoscillum furvescens DSM 4134]
MKEGDRVKQLFTIAERHGTIVGIYDEDFYINTPKGQILFATKGELKVQFDGTSEGTSITLSPQMVQILG